MTHRIGRPRGDRWRLALAANVAFVVAAGCATPSPSATPIASATPVIVTFDVGDDETFKVLLTQPDDIAAARRAFAGDDVPGIPDGRVLHVAGVNAPWSWSLDPTDITFTDETNETCDGLPSEVESGDVAGGRYCPWAAEITAIDPAPAGS